MKLFRKFRIKTQFYGLLAFVLVSLSVSTAGIYRAITPINTEWDLYQSEIAKRQTLLMDIKSHFGYGGTIHNFKNYVLRGSDKYLSRLDHNFSQLYEMFSRYRAIPKISKQEQLALQQIAQVADQYRKQIQQVTQMVRDGKSASEIDKVVKINDAPAFEGFSHLDDEYKTLTNAAHQSLSNNIDRAVNAALVGAFVTLLFVSLGFLAISRTILGGINSVREAMIGAERENDIHSRLPDIGKDEISDLAGSFNRLMDRFVIMITQVAQSATAVGRVTENQVAQVEKTVASVNKQHEEIDQIATAMNQMSMAVQEVEENTARAALSATRASEEALKGDAVMTETINSINLLQSHVESSADVISKLDHVSQDISKVLDVISSISEQTSLLALNAAIEAARAGEHGRGFAVVADEVRALATKTKGSTSEIGTMIERLQSQARTAVDVMKESQRDALNSSSQAEKAGEALTLVVREIATITDMTTQIAGSARQQSNVSEEMSNNIARINREAETAAKMAGDMQLATREINSRVDELTAQAAQFKVK